MSAHPIAKNARKGEQVAMSTPAPAQQGTGRVDDVSAGDQVVANEPVRRDPRAKIAAALVQSALLERHVHWTSPPMGDEHIDQQQWEELCAAYRATWQHREVRDDIAWTQAPEGLGFDPHARVANACTESRWSAGQLLRLLPNACDTIYSHADDIVAALRRHDASKPTAKITRTRDTFRSAWVDRELAHRLSQEALDSMDRPAIVANLKLHGWRPAKATFSTYGRTRC